MGFGFVVARFGLFLREMAPAKQAPPPPSGISLGIGTTLGLLGVFVSRFAAGQHARFVQRLDRGDPYRPPVLPLGIVVAVILGILGIGMTIYLLTMRA